MKKRLGVLLSAAITIGVPTIVIETAVVAGAAVAAASSPDCQRAITAMRKPKPKRHSKETLDAWAKWRHDHPGWKPKTRKETLAALDFACRVPAVVVPSEAAGLLLPKPEAAELPILPAESAGTVDEVLGPEMAVYRNAALPTDSTTDDGGYYGGGGWYGGGGYAGGGKRPTKPGNPGGPAGPGGPGIPPVPEPQSLLLFGTGLALLAGVGKLRHGRG